PLITATFNLERSFTVPPMFGLEAEVFPQPISFARFDISLNVIEEDNEFILYCDYNTDLFEASTIKRFLDYFRTLLAGIVAAPTQPVATQPLLAAAERHHLLVTCNATQTPLPAVATLHQLFEQQVARSPDALAVVCATQTLTYRALNQRAN